jgi:ABC-type branched-subunit amino acid transport system substrate-binding protein
VPAGEASEGVFDFQWWYPDSSVPANKAYVDAYAEMWPGMVPLSEGTYEYIDLMVMLKSIDAAGSLTDLDKIYDAMMALDWITPHGTPVKILPDGQVYVDTHFIVTVENGELVIIDQVDVPESLYRWWDREPERIWWE